MTLPKPLELTDSEILDFIDTHRSAEFKLHLGKNFPDQIEADGIREVICQAAAILRQSEILDKLKVGARANCKLELGGEIKRIDKKIDGNWYLLVVPTGHEYYVQESEITEILKEQENGNS